MRARLPLIDGRPNHHGFESHAGHALHARHEAHRHPVIRSQIVPGASVDEVLADDSYLEREDVRDALKYAATDAR